MAQVVPFLKWAGGKRWLIPHAGNLFPDSFDRYIEPFLGGGAVFFHLKPQKAILTDINGELIQTYKAIRDNWRLVFSHLQRHQDNHSSDYYYEIRASKPRTPATKAARMLYLNRTCWNGLYRVNLKGEFNVPIGTKNTVLLDSDDFPALAKLLEGVRLECNDFEWAIDQATEDDFVFVDPPYTVKHNLNGFIKYNETLFAWKDQVRLRDAVDRAVRRVLKLSS
jgi:DNA adenine methylase